MNLRTVGSEAIQSVRASGSTTIAATITVLIGMFLLGVSIALGTWLLSWSRDLDHQITVKAFFKDTATLTQKNLLTARLQDDPRVKSLRYIPKEEAFSEEKRKHPAIYSGVDFNPLPDALTIVPKQGKLAAKIRESLTPLPSFVDKVKDGGATSKRILRVGKIVWIVFLVMVVVLLMASTLLIANTLRLSIFARRREIEVMKLVGASNWFVRGPFMLEGLLCGLAGSLAAVLLLLLGKEIAMPAILGHIDDSSQTHALAFAVNALILVGMGLAIGAAASGFTLRRFLRI